MSVTLIVMMVLRIFAYVQTHQIVHIKYMQFFIYVILFFFFFKNELVVYEIERSGFPEFTENRLR